MTLSTVPNPGPSGLHVRYEKAGLILDSLPIPWNADAVIIEANVRLPAKSPREKRDFALEWSAGAPRLSAELLVPATKKTPMRVFFRADVPEESASARVYWRENLLGEVAVPIVGMKATVDGFSLELATVYAGLGEDAIAARAFVAAQAKNVYASALVRSAGLLASVVELGLRVEVNRPNGESVGLAHIHLTNEQMRSRQTLVTVPLPKMRTMGNYEVSWHLASRCLHTQRVRIISKKILHRTLRISATRFYVKKSDGTFHTIRTLPTRDGKLLLDDIVSIEPFFYVSSSEAGMAGLVPFTLRALVDDVITTVEIEENVLVTDGLRPIMLGSLPLAELGRVKHFTLAVGDRVLGNLPLLPAPSADFTAEGGFAPLDEFLWSPAAEEQFSERLGKLLEDG